MDYNDLYDSLESIIKKNNKLYKKEIKLREPKTNLAKAGLLIASIPTAPVALALGAARSLASTAFSLVTVAGIVAIAPGVVLTVASSKYASNADNAAKTALGVAGGIAIGVPTALIGAGVLAVNLVGNGIVKILNTAYNIAALPIKALSNKQLVLAKDKKIDEIQEILDEITTKIKNDILSYDPEANLDDLSIKTLVENEKVIIRSCYDKNKMVDIVFDGEYKPKEYQKNMFFAMALNNDGLNVDREDLQENWSKKSLNLKLKMLKTFNKFLSENAPDAIGEEQSELKDFLFQDITDMF